MADLSSIAQAYDNAGAEITAARATANFEQIVNTQGLTGRLIIAEVNKGTGNINETELVALTKALASAGGSCNGNDRNGPDAFTVVGITAFDGSDPCYIALQGTGTLGTSSGDYVSDVTLTITADFALAV